METAATTASTGGVTAAIDRGARYVEMAGGRSSRLQALAGLDGDVAAHPYALVLARPRRCVEMERYDDAAARRPRRPWPTRPPSALLYLLSVAEEGRGP